MNLYQNVLGCISDQALNVQKAHVSYRTSWPDSPKLNIGVTGFELDNLNPISPMNTELVKFRDKFRDKTLLQFPCANHYNKHVMPMQYFP